MSSLPLPDDARVTLTVGQLRALIEGRDLETFDGIPTGEAAKLTGEKERRLRTLWAQWDRIQRDGGRPPVRVSRKGASDRSDMLFDRSDCLLYRNRRPDAPVRPEPSPEPAGDPDDIDAITDRLLDSRGASGAS